MKTSRICKTSNRLGAVIILLKSKIGYFSKSFSHRNFYVREIIKVYSIRSLTLHSQCPLYSFKNLHFSHFLLFYYPCISEATHYSIPATLRFLADFKTTKFKYSAGVKFYNSCYSTFFIHFPINLLPQIVQNMYQMRNKLNNFTHSCDKLKIKLDRNTVTSL